MVKLFDIELFIELRLFGFEVHGVVCEFVPSTILILITITIIIIEHFFTEDLFLILANWSCCVV